jgi:hypothetical protein
MRTVIPTRKVAIAPPISTHCETSSSDPIIHGAQPTVATAATKKSQRTHENNNQRPGPK